MWRPTDSWINPYTKVEDIGRVIIDRYKGVTITKDEYILLATTIFRQLIDLLINIDPKSK